MKQVFFNRQGKVLVEDVPASRPGPGQVLVRLSKSLISTGTEMSSYDRGGMITEIAQQPGLISKVAKKTKEIGVRKVVSLVLDKLDERIPKGYSAVGTVLAVGDGVFDVSIGQKVVVLGAPHAQFVVAPTMMVAPVPAGVADSDAVFTTLATIPLHGIRLAGLELGCTAAVVGLGLVGQVAVRLLKAAGIRIIAIDVDPARVLLASKSGADFAFQADGELVANVMKATGNIGVDAALICAASSSSAPINDAMSYCRDRAKIVSVGSVGMELNRTLMFTKELEVVVSRSYGPGRYDDNYEQRGHDYPIGYVRWTEKRNALAILDLMYKQQLLFSDLVKAEYSIDKAGEAYRLLAEDKSAVAVLLNYPKDDDPKYTLTNKYRCTKRCTKKKQDAIRVGIIGLGTFARNNIMPHLQSNGSVILHAVCTSSGMTAVKASGKYGFLKYSTDYKEVINDSEVDAIIIATRHDLHYSIAREAIMAGKHVHVEKPMCITVEEAKDLEALVVKSDVVFTIGFNRRHATDILAAKAMLDNRNGPAEIIIRVNAGRLPVNHWVYSSEGGGRLVGEVCHFIDLVLFLVGNEPTKINAFSIGDSKSNHPEDGVTISILFSDGSQASIVYLAFAAPNLPKEYIEIHSDSKSFIIDDFSRYTIYGPGVEKKVSHKMDKGFSRHFSSFIEAIQKGSTPFLPTVQDGLKVAQLIKLCQLEIYGSNFVEEDE